MPAAKNRIGSSKNHAEVDLTKNREPRCAVNTTGGNAVGDKLHGVYLLS
jgi:hypothetical protein